MRLRRDAIQVDQVLRQLAGPDNIDADDVKVTAFRLKSGEVEGDQVGDVGGAFVTLDGDIGADFLKSGDDVVFSNGMTANRVAEELDGHFFVCAAIEFVTIRQCQASRDGKDKHQQEQDKFTHC